MKKTNTLMILGLVALVPFLMSSEDGVAEGQNKDRTGAPGSQTTCGATNCHDDGEFTPSISFTLLDASGSNPVSEYIAGETYTVQWTFAGGGSAWGFQATALTDANTNAGEFQNPGSFVQLEDVNGRHIIEHSDPNPANSFIGEWVAPQPGSGPVTFYAAGVAANGNGFASGDGFAGAINTTVPEMASSIFEAALQFNVVVSGRTATFANNLPGQLSIFSMMGKLVDQSGFGPGQTTKNLDGFASGVYIMQFQHNNEVVTQQVLLN